MKKSTNAISVLPRYLPLTSNSFDCLLGSFKPVTIKWVLVIVDENPLRMKPQSKREIIQGQISLFDRFKRLYLCVLNFENWGMTAIFDINKLNHFKDLSIFNLN